tara:strand:+ start:278 stop:835 length:558 start_codon:yes stop_codon:yes gene_type:complete
MPKKRAGRNSKERLIKAKDSLYVARADLQAALEAHDHKLVEIINTVNERLGVLVEEIKEQVVTTNACLQDLANKRDNVEARLKGRKAQHPKMTKNTSEVLAAADAALKYHQEALEQLLAGGIFVVDDDEPDDDQEDLPEEDFVDEAEDQDQQDEDGGYDEFGDEVDEEVLGDPEQPTLGLVSEGT